ncbi:TlpA family protein disulfide reductase [Solilutibacter silvestris]|uniref:Redoxin n=1 Tax=Solilutibacter silvestris TaxID=1645665 RepID=A0A2K1Q285_9GAMM|nr:TlpA disulfide reductase family protein [Lysobacter silvestris]PNS09142.1 Redoxin [Lysobacter silvestris]
MKAAKHGRFGTIILLALVFASALLFATLVTQGFAPLWRTQIGQQALDRWLRFRAHVPEGTPMARAGEALPQVELADLQGARIPLPAAYLGKPLLINLWATWCGPCLREMPLLDALSASGTTRVVGVAWDEAADVRAFVQQRAPGYPVLLATPTKANATLFGDPSGVLPYTVLVDGKGRVVRQHVGPFESADELAAWVKVD